MADDKLELLISEVEKAMVILEQMKEQFETHGPPWKPDCEWSFERYSGAWRASCESSLAFYEIGPADETASFCPNCGGKIVVKDE